MNKARLFRNPKTLRKLCLNCAERRALFEYKGEIRWDKHHTLCFECFRDIRNRSRLYD
jgi:hypothetical protein